MQIMNINISNESFSAIKERTVQQIYINLSRSLVGMEFGPC
jgi:hypothetical protein